MKMPSQEFLRQILDYDPETGKLFWKERDVSLFPAVTPSRSRSLCALWNERYANNEALGSVNKQGYKAGRILNQTVTAHRVIWKLVTGKDPDQVDHINGLRSDNRLSNLRNVDRLTNQRNAGMRRDNMSGATGVGWVKASGKWQARITVFDRRIHLGRFNTFNDAVSARKAAEREHGFHENHGRS